MPRIKAKCGVCGSRATKIHETGRNSDRIIISCSRRRCAQNQRIFTDLEAVKTTRKRLFEQPGSRQGWLKEPEDAEKHIRLADGDSPG